MRWLDRGGRPAQLSGAGRIRPGAAPATPPVPTSRPGGRAAHPVRGRPARTGAAIMNAVQTNRLRGLMTARNAPREPGFRRPEPARPEAPAHWLRRFLDVLMRTLAVPSA